LSQKLDMWSGRNPPFHKATTRLFLACPFVSFMVQNLSLSVNYLILQRDFQQVTVTVPRSSGWCYSVWTVTVTCATSKSRCSINAAYQIWRLYALCESSYCHAPIIVSRGASQCGAHPARVETFDAANLLHRTTFPAYGFCKFSVTDESELSQTVHYALPGCFLGFCWDKTSTQYIDSRTRL